jgi:hypothetical protein
LAWSPSVLSARIKIVREGRSGQEVPITLVRGGKTMTLQVRLGERELQTVPERRRVFRLFSNERLRHMFEEPGSAARAHAWDSFDAMRLSRLDANRWRAEIEFRSWEGKKMHRSFEGTREEIRKDILAESERSRFVRALDRHAPVFEFPFAPFQPIGLHRWDQP